MAKLGSSPFPRLSLPPSLPQVPAPKDLRSNRITTIRTGRSGSVSGCSARLAAASNTSTDSLKTQLELLHSESDQTRARANAARGRFMRLTETVENLGIRAAIELRAGKEESARQLIAEKQKIMRALERSKKRAEILEDLSNKLGEAISVKESQLIALLSSSNPGAVDSNYDTTTSVRIVSSKAEDLTFGKSVDVGSSTLEADETQDNVLCDVESEEHIAGDTSIENVDHSMSAGRSDPYLSFLSKIDNNLDEVETQLYDFIHVATMILPKGSDVTTNQKVATVKQIWHDVQIIRARINSAQEKECIIKSGDDGADC